MRSKTAAQPHAAPPNISVPETPMSPLQVASGGAPLAAQGGSIFVDAARRDALIMMVDDEPTTIEVLRMFLEDAGYTNFVTTSDSSQALALIAARRPDVVLLDLMMPEVGGFEILGAMRDDPQMRHTPVIMLTSATDAVTKLTALELGATDFLGKPVDPSELALRLRNTLAAKAHQDSLVLHDQLTGLPNRQLFNEQLDRALYVTRQSGRYCAVLHLDLNRFQQINDSVGHAAGDSLLKSIAQRIETVVGWFAPGDRDACCDSPLVARLGGDEFAILVPEATQVARVIEIADRVGASFKQPFVTARGEVYVASSMGIAVAPQDGDDGDTLLRHASAATAFAKQRGLKGYHFYAGQDSERVNERFDLEHLLHKAIERNQLELFYQPKLCLISGRVTGAEALMRWRLPDVGLVPPDKFIPIAEESGLIIPIGEWAMHAACMQLAQWQRGGHLDLNMAVNVSAIQFRDGGLLDVIRSALCQSGIAAEKLTIELTESLLMENVRESTATLARFREMGLKISIDDFGTGYSSLSYLKRFAADELKIDRSFLHEVPTDSDNCAIVSAVIGMARGLGLSVVAEGVETHAQADYLKAQACRQFQGFLVSKAVPADDFLAFLGQARGRHWQYVVAER